MVVIVVNIIALCITLSVDALMDKVTTDCELEAFSVGTRLADQFNLYDEDTEWDVRMHTEYMVEHMGFSGWIQSGLWKNTKLTAEKQSAPELHQRGGWAGSGNISESAYWAMQNQWVYMMGDSTQRQVWATFVSPFQDNNFERNAKEWTRDNCARQYPHRKNHPSGGYFPDEGWYGKCGNNELTCHLSGFGPEGKISFDWKHFPWEDYDEWIFGPEGLWNGTSRHPDVLVLHIGLHTCNHAWESPTVQNNTMIAAHKQDTKTLMKAVRSAIERTPASMARTQVIVQLAGRVGLSQPSRDECSRTINRVTAYEAHLQGFPVIEREEIERRLLYKSEYYDKVEYMKPILHLDNPAPNIVGTSLLALIACLRRNGTDYNVKYRPDDVL